MSLQLSVLPATITTSTSVFAAALTSISELLPNTIASDTAVPSVDLIKIVGPDELVVVCVVHAPLLTVPLEVFPETIPAGTVVPNAQLVILSGIGYFNEALFHAYFTGLF